MRRARRHRSIRKKIWGTADRPRLVVFRSIRNIEGQVVDDDAGKTLFGLSTLHSDLRDFEAEGSNPRIEHAFAAGKKLGEAAKGMGIEAVVFDRGGYQFDGMFLVLG
jgi:large subunit ribosomal protein L18